MITSPFNIYREYTEVNIELTKEDINKLMFLAYKNNRSHFIRFTSGMLFSEFLEIYNLISSGRILRDYDHEYGLLLREEMNRISIEYIRNTCQYICNIDSGEIYHLNGRMIRIANNGEFEMDAMYYSENIITDRELDIDGYYYKEKYPRSSNSGLYLLDYKIKLDKPDNINNATIFIVYSKSDNKYLIMFEHNFDAVFDFYKKDNTRFNIKNLPQYFEE